MPSTVDLARNMRLHLGEAAATASSAGTRRVLASASVPSIAVRSAQRLAMKLGRLDWEHAWLAPLIAARREALGEDASGPPRFLVRVDEFPYYTAFDQPDQRDIEMSRRFHDVMASNRVPHLMSIVPQLTHSPLVAGLSGGRALGDIEVELIDRMRRDDVTFAQHGTTHRTRFQSPRRRSEFCGLSPAGVEEILEDGRRRLAEVDVHPRVFVPPFNRFDAAHYAVLADRFEVVCGGPESVPLMGFHGGPLWRDGAVYLPCYAPLYANAQTILPEVERLIDLAPGTWIPIVLHTSWEQEDRFRSLERLAHRIAPFAESWEHFLAAVSSSGATADGEAPLGAGSA
ncbi:MAG: DUF2334 domain-containing protein [Solirubrobacterales bacterium]